MNYVPWSTNAMCHKCMPSPMWKFLIYQKSVGLVEAQHIRSAANLLKSHQGETSKTFRIHNSSFIQNSMYTHVFTQKLIWFIYIVWVFFNKVQNSEK